MTIADKLRKDGIEQGIEIGIAQGIEKGERQHALATAERLFARKMPLTDVLEIAGLTEEDLRAAGLIA